MALILIASFCLLFVLSRTERVSHQECLEIRKRAERWKPSPSDPYNDADRITESIYLGNVCAAHNDSWLEAENISVVISVAREWPLLPYKGNHSISFYHFPMEDTFAQGERGVRWAIRETSILVDYLVSVGKVLVHCNMGISRSSAIVIHYLQEYEREGSDYKSVEAYVKSKRPVIKPNALFRRILIKEDL